jgi:hypothetical protein
MRDPSMLGSDGVAASKAENDAEERTKSERKSRVGFSKRLLKNKDGEEQCFEEARALAGAYILLRDSSSNVNLLRATKSDQSSQMDLEDEVECSIDISMVESDSRLAEYSTGSRTEGRRLFQPDVSLDAGLNQTATSNASSTINILDAVGLPAKKEEETINTKFAMKELSMMFSSPAVGVDGTRRLQDQSRGSRIDEKFASQSPGDASFDNVGDSLGNVLLDNSICNIGVEENRGELFLRQRTPGLNGFEPKGRQKLKRNPAVDASLDLKSVGPRHTDGLLKDGPLRPRRKDSDSNSGFHILKKSPASEDQQHTAKGLQVFVETEAVTLKDKSDHHVDERNSFATHHTVGNLDEHSAASSDFTEYDASHPANGDTASISEALFVLEDGQTGAFPTAGRTNDDDNTATLSLFNDVFHSEDRTHISHPIEISNPEVKYSSGGQFEIYIDGADEGGNQVS